MKNYHKEDNNMCKHCGDLFTVYKCCGKKIYDACSACHKELKHNATPQIANSINSDGFYNLAPRQREKMH
jgi:hypothetical protein